MRVKRILSVALAATLMFSTNAFAADTPLKERIVTTQNGTGYTVSSVGQHVIPTDDNSHSFIFASTDGYDISRLVITDGQHTDHADVTRLEQDLKLNGVSYPIDYQSKTDAHGTSVIRATVAIPAAQDNITLSAKQSVPSASLRHRHRVELRCPPAVCHCIRGIRTAWQQSRTVICIVSLMQS